MRNKTFIIGCGRLGAAAAVDGYKKGDNIFVFDPDTTAFDRLPDDFGGLTFEADATDLTTLEKQGIRDCRSVLITTGDDNVNVFLAHVCDKLYEIPNIYVRFDDPERKVLVEGYNVKCIYPFELSFGAYQGLKGGDRQ